MNKTELIEAISIKTEFNKSDIERVLEALVDITIRAVKKNDRVLISGLGTFELSERAERIGINPSTMEKIKIEARRVPKFKPAKSFKEMVDK